MKFMLRNGVTAKVMGPAEFEVQRVGDSQVVLNLIAGDYLEISSEEGEYIEQEGENLVIKTPEFELEKVYANDELHVVIATEDGKRTIANEG